MNGVIFELEESNEYSGLNGVKDNVNGLHDVNDVDDEGDEDDAPIQIIRLDQGYRKKGAYLFEYTLISSVFVSSACINGSMLASG